MQGICGKAKKKALTAATVRAVITGKPLLSTITIAGNHLMLTSEHTAREIEQKARKVMGMLKRGIKFTPTQPDVMAILEKLRERR